MFFVTDAPIDKNAIFIIQFSDRKVQSFYDNLISFLILFPESAKLNSKNSNATRTVIPKQKRYQNACKKSIIRVKRV